MDGKMIKNMVIDIAGWTVFGPIVRKITERNVSKSTKLCRMKNMTAMLCQQINAEYADVLALK